MTSFACDRELLKSEVCLSNSEELKLTNSAVSKEPNCGNRNAAIHDEDNGKPTSHFTVKHKMLILTLTLSNFCSYLAFSTIAPFFPKEASAKGASDWEVGFIFGVFQLVIFIVAPIYGKLMSKTGVKFMYISGLFICCICITLFGFLDGSRPGVVFVALCFICRILDANGTAMLTTASFAILANTFPDRIGLVLGFLEVGLGFGVMAGPPIGGFLYEVGGFRLPFLVVGGCLILTCLVSYIIVPNIGNSTEDKGSHHSLLKIPDVLLSCLVMYGCGVQISFLESTLTNQITSIAPMLGAAAVGAIFLAAPGSYFLLTPAVGYFCGKAGHFLKVIILAGCVLSTVSMLLMGPTPLIPMLSTSLWLLIFSMILRGIGIVGCWVPSYQLCTEAAIKQGFPGDVSTYGVVGGILGSASALGAFSGATGGVSLVNIVGFSWAATCCAGLTLLMVFATGASILLQHLRPTLSRCTTNSADGKKENISLLQVD